MNKTQTGMNLALSIALLALNVVLLNLNVGTRLLRTDFTEGSYYALSPATEDLLHDLEEPVKLHFYYTSKEKQHELLRPLISPLRDLIDEFAAAGGDKIEALNVEMDKADKAERDAVRDAYGVRSHPIPVKTTFESSLKNLYFELVIAQGSSVERYGLGQNFEQILRQVDEGDRMALELGDVEYAIAKAIRKVSQGFDSAAGALVARDAKAEATLYLTEKSTLPKGLETASEVVKKVIAKISKESGGRMSIVIKDPYEGKKAGEERTAEIQRLYRKYGIKPMAKSLLGDSSFYASMLIKVGDRIAAVDLLPDGDELDEATVKETIEGTLKRLIPGFLPTIAIASPAPAQNPMMMRMGQRPRDEFAYLKRILDAEFDVQDVNLGGENPKIPREAEALLIVRPGDLSDEALYAIDQFVMRGGRLVVCSDSFYIDMARARSESLPIGEDKNEKLRKLLAHWGVDLKAEALLDERSERLEHLERSAQGYPEVVYDYIPFALRVRKGQGWDDHPICAGVRGLTFYAASPLALGKLPEGVKGTLVAQSSDHVEATTSTARLKSSIASTPFKAGGTSQAMGLIAALEGSFPSYFSDQPIPGRDFTTLSTDGSKKDGDPSESPLLKKSQTTAVVVIGDSDFLSLDVVNSLSMLGDSAIDAYATANVRLIQNALQWGGHSDPLAAIRQRPPFRRPIEGLANMSADERADLGLKTLAITAGASLAALLLLGVGWSVYRKTRPPLDLDLSESGGEA